TTWRRCGACSSSQPRTTTWSPPASRIRCASWWRSHSASPGSTGRVGSARIRRSSARPRSTTSWVTPPRRDACSAGGPRSASRRWSTSWSAPISSACARPDERMRVLVAGGSGVAGPVVAHPLAEHGHEVHGVARRPPEPGRLGGAPLEFHGGDVCDPVGLGRLVACVAPSGIVHLAAVAEPAAAGRDPEATYRTNLGGTLALLAAVRAGAPRARVLVVSSSSVYGAVEARELPVREENPLRPLTVYGASKAAAEIAALQCSRAYGLEVV